MKHEAWADEPRVREFNVFLGEWRRSDMSLCYIDTETTGLNPAIHDPYEVCLWREGNDEPTTYRLPHSLVNANPAALKISRYFERGFSDQTLIVEAYQRRSIFQLLNGATLVGSNPSFDAAMMTKYLGVAVWHHRMIDISNVAMTLFNWDLPNGMADVVQHLNDLGWEIPDPDHSAEGDVRVTKAVYETLRELRNTMEIGWADG